MKKWLWEEQNRSEEDANAASLRELTISCISRRELLPIVFLSAQIRTKVSFTKRQSGHEHRHDETARLRASTILLVT